MEIKDLVLKSPTFSAPASIITAVSDNLDLIKEYADILKAALLALEKGTVTQEEYDKFVASIGANMIKYGNSDFPNVGMALDALFGSVSSLKEKAEIVVMPEGQDIPISQRKEHGIYLKVTDTQSTVVATGTVYVSPGVGMKLIDED